MLNYAKSGPYFTLHMLPDLGKTKSALTWVRHINELFVGEVFA